MDVYFLPEGDRGGSGPRCRAKSVEPMKIVYLSCSYVTNTKHKRFDGSMKCPSALKADDMSIHVDPVLHRFGT